jgi:peptidoglycan/xylan/chitin deacetylase (PgdA/CDA1 family)
MASRGIVFLMYHELEAPGRALCQTAPGYVRYVLRKEEFQAQMAWLHRSHWKGLSVGEALSYPAGTSVAISFDDGCESDLEIAAPILKDLGYHATFYVTAGFLDKPGYLSSSQLRELSAQGFEIGCHSMTHAYLDDLDSSGLQREISDARIKLEDVVGKRVEHFSCPGGRSNAATIAFAKKVG